MARRKTMKEGDKNKRQEISTFFSDGCVIVMRMQSSRSVEYGSYVANPFIYWMHENTLENNAWNKRALLAQLASSLQEEKKIKKGKNPFQVNCP